MPLDPLRNRKDLVSPKRLCFACHAKPANLSDLNKVVEEPSSNNPSISILQLPLDIDPSILHDYPVQNDPDLVTTIEALSGLSPNLTPQCSDHECCGD
ncbi:unnamed protein product [Lactuca virosa]|uniref:Cytochrome c domain-containing protein n=1 Tax=Lactuca virosa TaxID=75947 RepID=A0AAU9PBW3_9ASTR|nr:unnamed protein product [Lactuca virosa]